MTIHIYDVYEQSPDTITLPDSVKLYNVYTETGDGLPYKKFIGYCPYYSGFTIENSVCCRVQVIDKYIFFYIKGLVDEDISVEEGNTFTLPEPVYFEIAASEMTYSFTKRYRLEGMQGNFFTGTAVKAQNDYSLGSRVSSIQTIYSIETFYLPFSYLEKTLFAYISKYQFDKMIEDIKKKLKI